MDEEGEEEVEGNDDEEEGPNGAISMIWSIVRCKIDNQI